MAIKKGCSRRETCGLFALGLLLGWATMLWWPAQPGFVPPAPSQPDTSFGSQYASVVQGYQRTADAHQPDGATVFLGDSHTQGLAVAAVAPVAINYGVGGLNTERLLRVLPRLSAVHRARLVVLMIGSNDIPAQDQDAFEGRLEAIAASIDAPLVWHAIPRNRRVPADVTAKANAAIARICEARPRCRFVETEFGPEDFQRDGSHLSPSGYRKWIASLRGAVGP
jgi:lysophospholipase L1-like esterase